MAKLHELLAVHSNLETQLVQTGGQLKDTFTKKHTHFGEKLKVFHPDGEGQEPITEEQSALQTTVSSELEWVSKFFIQAMDVSHQIDETNTLARADVILDDKVILAGLPATTLLELGKRLVVLQELFTAIPTLDPVKAFEVDPTFRIKGVYKAREVVKIKTAKKNKPLVLYEATDKHPAQVQLLTEDLPIGKIRETEWSGMITPAEKAGMLERVDAMIRAVKQALSRANNVDVNTSKRIGKQLMDYLIKGSI